MHFKLLWGLCAVMLVAIGCLFVNSGQTSLDQQASAQGTAANIVDSQLAQHKKDVSAQDYTVDATTDGALQAHNAAIATSLRFDTRGVTLQQEAQDQASTIRLHSVGLGSDQSTLPRAQAKSPLDQLVEYHRRGTVEWFQNDERGLTTGYTITKRPESQTQQDAPLRMVVEVEGEAASKNDGKISVAGLDYHNLRAWDSTGRALPVVASVGSNNQLVIDIDDSNAVYPIVANPTLTNRDVIMSNPGSGGRVSPVKEDGGKSFLLPSGKLLSRWGYNSTHSTPCTIAIGSNNRFSPGHATDEGQPEVFLPGRQVNVFDVIWDGVGNLVWTLDGRTGTAGGNAHVVPDTVIGERGTVTNDQPDRSVWYQVDLNSCYDKPVVVMGPASRNGGQPVTIRVQNVTSTSFEYQILEYEYLDGYHVSEDVSYLVVEAGTWDLGGDVTISAGCVNDVTTAYSTGLTGTDTQPIVLSQVVTTNEATAVVSRNRNVDSTAFDVRLREQEAGNGHAPEDVAYVALEIGSTVMEHGGGCIEIGSTGDNVTHTTKTINFAKAVTSPVFLADMQTRDGGDTSTVRRKALTGSSAQVFIEEEQSHDSELNHTTENVGYVVFDGAGYLFGQVPTASASNR